VHCRGFAADSDDWYNERAAAVWRDNGWRQTARYFDRNGRPTAKDEPWHGEYPEKLDTHRNAPAPAGAASKEDAMFPAILINKANPSGTFYLYDLRTQKVIRPISSDENNAFRAAEKKGAAVYITVSATAFKKAGGE